MTRITALLLKVVLYNRAALYKKEVEQPVIPFQRLQVTKEGTSVTTLDIQDQVMVTGSSDGSVCLFDLSTSKMVETLSQGGSMVYQVCLGPGGGGHSADICAPGEAERGSAGGDGG